MQADTRSVKSHKSASKTVSDNECHQLFDDNRTSSGLPMKISNLSEGSSKECFTKVGKQSSATKDLSEPSATCNESDYDNLKRRLQHAELRAQEATLKLQASKCNYK